MQTDPTAVNGRYYLTNEFSRGTVQVSPAKEPGASVLTFIKGSGKQAASVGLSPGETRALIAALESVSDEIRYSVVQPAVA